MNRDNEDILNMLDERVRRRQSFRVPENYFSQLGDSIMEGLPEQNHTVGVKKARIVRIHPWQIAVSAAASVALLLGVAVTIHEDIVLEEESSTSESVHAVGHSIYNCSVDKDDIYYYLIADAR